MKVEQIILEVNKSGYTYPVFITGDGKRYIPRHTATGSCWVTDWVEEVSPQVINK